ncbi:hypothetical protein KCP69_05155 [Salmonella enterica subsp. enterica]|nr:hypothetical protein KCP69_05155 [Salmonella enterica subsp. enterica]
MWWPDGGLPDKRSASGRGIRFQHFVYVAAYSARYRDADGSAGPSTKWWCMVFGGGK